MVIANQHIAALCIAALCRISAAVTITILFDDIKIVVDIFVVDIFVVEL